MPDAVLALSKEPWWSMTRTLEQKLILFEVMRAVIDG